MAGPCPPPHTHLHCTLASPWMLNGLLLLGSLLGACSLSPSTAHPSRSSTFLRPTELQKGVSMECGPASQWGVVRAWARLVAGRVLCLSLRGWEVAALSLCRVRPWRTTRVTRGDGLRGDAVAAEGLEVPRGTHGPFGLSDPWESLGH